MPPVDIRSEQKDADSCADLLKALADPVRLRIAKALQVSPLSVSDIAELLDSDIAKVSHHLRVMYNLGLVTTERDGRHIYYALNAAFLKGRAANKSLDFGCCKFEIRA